MKKRQLAIVFDDYSVRFIEAKIKGNRIKTIYNTFIIENNNLIKDGVFDKIEWNKLFNDLLHKKILKTKTVHVIIPTSLVILRQQALPDLPVEQLKHFIANEIGNTIFFPFEDPIFDIVKIESEEPITNEDGETTREGLIIATPGAVINDIIEILKEEKFKILSIDIPALSYFRYIELFFPDIKYETKLLCYITDNGIDLHIFDKDILYFTRHIPKDLQKNYFFGDEDKFNDQGFASGLSFEIERAKNYFNFTLNNRTRKISGIVISSERALTDMFIDSLKEMIGIDITVIGNLNRTLPRKVKQFKGYEVGIGAFFREVKK